MRKLQVAVMPGKQAVYTVEEARAILKIGRSAMIRLCLSGIIRRITIGRSRRIPASAIEEFLAGGSESGDAA